jgi:hypothetical protein
MPGIDNLSEEAATREQPSGKPVEAGISSDVERLIDDMTFEGNLASMIACACEKAMMYQPPSHADPGLAPHPGVQAAISAFAAWKLAEGQVMATDITQHSDQTKQTVAEPEILPLSLAGKWVAWSSDGMRIVAFSETSDEAERLAISAGELEPILERHPGRYRL